jgi:hypothetical protein
MKASQESKYDIVRGRIVNRATGKAIPADEPIIIMRAKDKHVPAMLRFYKKLCSNGNHKKVIQSRINQFVAWQRGNKEVVHEPDSANISEVLDLVGK